jgi:hypothetical protein
MAFFASEKSFTIFVASLYMLYGVSKLLLVLLVYIIPEQQLKKIPLMNLLIHKDRTVAGYMYEIVFGVFAVFTVLYALALYESVMAQSKTRRRRWLAWLLIPHLETFFMVILGIFLVVFYMLVIYTDLPISKNSNYKLVYWYMGVGGGLSFIVFPLLFQLVVSLFPILQKLSLPTKALIILIAVVVIAIAFGLLIAKFYKPYESVKEEADSHLLNAPGSS